MPALALLFAAGIFLGGDFAEYFPQNLITSTMTDVFTSSLQAETEIQGNSDALTIDALFHFKPRQPFPPVSDRRRWRKRVSDRGTRAFSAAHPCSASAIHSETEDAVQRVLWEKM